MNLSTNEEIIELLGILIKKYPDLRFTQLLSMTGINNRVFKDASCSDCVIQDNVYLENKLVISKISVAIKKKL